MSVPPAGEQVLLDVRPYQHEGREPFSDIMSAIESLTEGQQLVLLNTFAPEPLYRVLEAKGFEHHAEQVDEETWRITFWKAE